MLDYVVADPVAVALESVHGQFAESLALMPLGLSFFPELPTATPTVLPTAMHRSMHRSMHTFAGRKNSTRRSSGGRSSGGRSSGGRGKRRGLPRRLLLLAFNNPYKVLRSVVQGALITSINSSHLHTHHALIMHSPCTHHALTIQGGSDSLRCVVRYPPHHASRCASHAVGGEGSCSI
jgi:hypothetical protein